MSIEPFADNFIPVILVEDEPLHSSENPFCMDGTCPCHEDQEAIDLITQHVADGLMTPEEATDFVKGFGI